jgi:hypothetical protein
LRWGEESDESSGDAAYAVTVVTPRQYVVVKAHTATISSREMHRNGGGYVLLALKHRYYALPNAFVSSARVAVVDRLPESELLRPLAW